MLDGYLTTGMAKWYVQYTVHEMDAQAEMEGGRFFIFVAHCARRCMHVSTQLPWRAAENASSSGGSVRRIMVHMRQPRYLGTYLSERTAAAAIAWATKDFLLPCGPKFS